MSTSSEKSKMGCITCRIRKVKCDERKPTCMRCMSTGRKCDGYRSNFRFVVGAGLTSSVVGPSIPLYQSRKAVVVFPGPEQVEYLAKHFTIKPVPAMGVSYGTGMSYEPEARATLCATSEPAIQHALASLNALRRAFYEQCGHPSPQQMYIVAPGTPGVQHGLQEYVHAIRSLSTKMLNNNASAIKSALLCCQMFMSIELALDDFSSATRHFTCGLCIMHECLSRPYLSEDGGVMAAQSLDMPAVDIFTIKLFLTPCPDGLTDDFLSSPNVGARGTGTLLGERAAVVQANMRLANLGRLTLHLLGGISQLSPSSSASTLVRERAGILAQLQIWESNFANIEGSRVCQKTAQARLGIAFSGFFCVVIRVAATLAIRPPGFKVKDAEPIFDNLLAVAEKLKQLKEEVKQKPLSNSLANTS